MASDLLNDSFTNQEYPSIHTDLIQIRLLKTINHEIVGVDLRIYYLGKRDDKVELPIPNAIHLVSKNLAAYCTN
ncbi:MAG: hypothetical protein ACE5R6_02505 [Candidatus Heimdallarchaeota archaeon]